MMNNVTNLNTYKSTKQQQKEEQQKLSDEQFYNFACDFADKTFTRTLLRVLNKCNK